jgi:hypothetical protein
MHDMIWFLHRRACSPSIPWHDLHPSIGTVPSPRCLSWSLRMSNVTYSLTISHHTPHYKTKLDVSIVFASFTWLLGLSRKNLFYLWTWNHNADNHIIALISPLRALCYRCHIHYSWRNWHPTSHFYTVHAICQAWNQSRVKCVMLVTVRFDQTMPQISTNTRWRVTIRLSMPTSPWCATIPCIDPALVPLLGFGANNKKIMCYATLNYPRTYLLVML